MAIIASGVKRIGIPSHKEGVDPDGDGEPGLGAAVGYEVWWSEVLWT
jgi:hypothetical protein